jgi:Lon protease-like protein
MTILQIPLFPLNTVLFPRMVLPLHIFEERYKTMLRYCNEHDSAFGVVLIRAGEEVGGSAEPHEVGTTARILREAELEEERKLIIVQGRERFRLLRMISGYPFPFGEIEIVPLDTAGVEAQMVNQVEVAFFRYLRLLKLAQGLSVSISNLPDDAEGIAWMIAWGLQLDLSFKQELLTVPTLARLLEQEREILRQENRILTVLASEQARRRMPPEKQGYISLN